MKILKKRKWSKFFLILYVICVLSYTAARIILKEYGYFYYDFFEKGKILLLLIGAVYIFCIGIGNLKRYKMRYPDRSITGGCILLGIFTVAAVGFFGNYFLKTVLVWDVPTYQSVEKQKEKVEEVEESEKQEQRGVYETIEDAYQYLYDKVLSLSYSSSSPQYNAKGNFYAVLETGTGSYHEQENVPYTIEVVYDRISDDGKSYMFNFYKIYETAEGDITDFGLRYLVNKYSGEITAEEVPWGN